MATKHCPNCGKPVQAGSLFCPNCGTKLKGSSNSSSSSGNMAEKAAKAAEAERRAKEEANYKKEMKKAARREKRDAAAETIAAMWEDFYIHFIISIIVGLLAIAAGVLLIVALNNKNATFTNIGRIAFWGSVGLAGFNIIFIIVCVICLFVLSPDVDYVHPKLTFWFTIVPTIFMAICTLCSINSVTKFKGFYHDKEGGVYYALIENKYSVYGLEGKKEDIVIKSSIDGRIVNKIEAKAFKNTEIKTVTFENGAAMTIGDSAFASCAHLESVNFGDGGFLIKHNAFKDDFFLNDFNINSAHIKTNFDETVRYGLRRESSILPDSDKRIITIDGGKYERIVDNAGTYIVSGEVTLDGTVMTNYNDNDDPLINDKLVLTAGFTFENSKIVAYSGIDFIKPKYTAIPFARNIYIPKSVTAIPADFFGDSLGEYPSLKIYYEGTEEEWSLVNVDTSSGNSIYVNNDYTIEYSKTYNA